MEELRKLMLDALKNNDHEKLQEIYRYIEKFTKDLSSDVSNEAKKGRNLSAKILSKQDSEDC